MSYQNKVFLSLGGNIGNTEGVSRIFQNILGEFLRVGIPIIKKSSIYKTSSYGNEKLPDFLNQCVEIETELSAEELLKVLQEIEIKFGRKKETKSKKEFLSRMIDIDILFFNSEIILKLGNKSSSLEIPHKDLHSRKFVLVPLNEIAPDFLHPVFRKSVHSLLQGCKDKGKVELHEYCCP